jgi:hypothetical protein
MAAYQRTHTEVVIETGTGKRLRPGTTAAWRRYLAWKAAGGVPDPPAPLPTPIDSLVEMRDLIDDAGQALYDATDLLEAKTAILDLFKALLGRHPNQRTTMAVREKG